MNDGVPAFPRPIGQMTMEITEGNYPQDGMSLRDWFAGQALTGLLAGVLGNPHHNDEDGFEFAKAAYKWADNMLERRTKDYASPPTSESETTKGEA